MCGILFLFGYPFPLRATLAFRLLVDGALNIPRGNKHLPFRNIIPGDVIDERIVVEIVVFRETVQFIEFHGVDSQLHGNRILETEVFMVFEGDELHAHFLNLVECAFVELLDEDL